MADKAYCGSNAETALGKGGGLWWSEGGRGGGWARGLEPCCAEYQGFSLAACQAVRLFCCHVMMLLSGHDNHCGLISSLAAGIPNTFCSQICLHHTVSACVIYTTHHVAGI